MENKEILNYLVRIKSLAWLIKEAVMDIDYIYNRLLDIIVKLEQSLKEEEE